MANTTHPANQGTRTAPPFVVTMSFGGAQRGVAGPFPTEEEATRWVEALLEGESGWTTTVKPLIGPADIPSAADRRAAHRRRHLTVVRPAQAAVPLGRTEETAVPPPVAASPTSKESCRPRAARP